MISIAVLPPWMRIKRGRENAEHDSTKHTRYVYLCVHMCFLCVKLFTTYAQFHCPFQIIQYLCHLAIDRVSSFPSVFHNHHFCHRSQFGSVWAYFFVFVPTNYFEANIVSICATLALMLYKR